MALPDNENRPKVEMFDHPDTPENMLRRAKKLKQQIKEIEESGRRPTQEQMRKMEFLPLDFSNSHLDLDEMFEDY